jgi:hypothetical protein
MKLSESLLALKTECVKNYGAVSRSPEMQKILHDAIAARKKYEADLELYRERVAVLQRELWKREDAGENVYIDFRTMTIEVL